MRLIAMEMVGLIICGMQLADSGAQRCVTDDAQFNRDASKRLTLNGRILSYESGCHAPLDSTAVRLYLGCLDSEFYEEEPFAGWKTDSDGMFEVTVPFNHDQAGLVHVEICLEPRRSCQPVTVEIPGMKPVLAQKPVAATASKPISVLASKPVSVHGFGGESLWSTASVSVCLGGKGQRRRRSTGWDDRDMNWLKRGLQQEASAKEGGKRGWSNGIPWLKRVQGKRLWEGADEEVGWIKRQDQKNPREGEIGAGSLDVEGSNSGAQPPKPSHSRQRPLADEHQVPVMRQRSVSKMVAWPQPEEMKKYWAESDMSWL